MAGVPGSGSRGRGSVVFCVLGQQGWGGHGGVSLVLGADTQADSDPCHLVLPVTGELGALQSAKWTVAGPMGREKWGETTLGFVSWKQGKQQATRKALG